MFSMVLASIAAIAAPAPHKAACPIVIAHRGASGERPEHTLSAYRLGIAQGADFIEPDLVMTKDDVLVARHENEISGTTDVAAHPQFADRRATKIIDGQPVTGWFTEDFTLAELRTLRARERLPQLRGTAHDGEEPIPTLAEILALVADTRAAGRAIGIVPEIKHPSYFAGIGKPMEGALVAALAAAGFRRRADDAMIQSFEVGNLRRLAGMTQLRLVQLVDAEGAPADRGTTPYTAMLTPAGLAEVARYAQVLSPAKALIVPRGADDASRAPTSLVADAHAAGLAVIPWTFRRENAFLPRERRNGTPQASHGDLSGEIGQFLRAGVDGIFSDNPAEAVAARDAFARGCVRR
jgi:glycerophosphoryl diester phosphodiesterase